MAKAPPPKVRSTPQKPKSGWFCDFDPIKDDVWLSRIEHKIDALTKKVDSILIQLGSERALIMTLQDDVNKLSDDLTALTTAVNGAIAALQAAAAEITTLKGQVADPAVVAKLEEITTGIEAQTSALSAATPTPTPTARRR